MKMQGHHKLLQRLPFEEKQQDKSSLAMEVVQEKDLQEHLVLLEMESRMSFEEKESSASVVGRKDWKTDFSLDSRKEVEVLDLY
jgi:hypothetical protein